MRCSSLFVKSCEYCAPLLFNTMQLRVT